MIMKAIKKQSIVNVAVEEILKEVNNKSTKRLYGMDGDVEVLVDGVLFHVYYDVYFVGNKRVELNVVNSFENSLFGHKVNINNDNMFEMYLSCN